MRFFGILLALFALAFLPAASAAGDCAFGSFASAVRTRLAERPRLFAARHAAVETSTVTQTTKVTTTSSTVTSNTARGPVAVVPRVQYVVPVVVVPAVKKVAPPAKPPEVKKAPPAAKASAPCSCKDNCTCAVCDCAKPAKKS